MNYLLINVRKDIEDVTTTSDQSLIFGRLLCVEDTGSIDDSVLAINNEDKSISSWRWNYYLKDDIKKIFENSKSNYDLVFFPNDNEGMADLVFRLYSDNKEALTMIKLMMNY